MPQFINKRTVFLVRLMCSLFFIMNCGNVKGKQNEKQKNPPPTFLLTKHAVDNYIATYKDRVPEERIKEVIMKTQLLSTKYTLKLNQWNTLLEKKLEISAKIVQFKINQDELSCMMFDLDEKTMHHTEDLIVLAGKQKQLQEYQAKYDQYYKEWDYCVKEASSDLRKEVDCDIIFRQKEDQILMSLET